MYIRKSFKPIGKFKCTVFFIQLLILILEVHSRRIFFRGKYFYDDSKKTLAKTDVSPVEEKWHSQKLNHFTTADKRTWYQRYYVNEAYYNTSRNNPIFLMVGGEGPISSGWMTGGFWVDRAMEHQALLLQLEHRFYGSSQPTTDVSTENLQYLTVEQALEDTVNFIESMKKHYNLGKNKWIAFGGSYSGNLVAWLRLKYPHLIYGAISSSAPVLSVVDFKDYYKVVAESLATYSRSCVKSITEAFASIDQLSQEKSGQETLTTTFNLCEPLEESEDFDNDFSMLNNALAGNFAGVVQYNKIDHSSNMTIDNICKIMENKKLGKTSLQRLAALSNIFLYTENATCLEYNYQNFIDYFSETNWNDSANTGGRQWFFQTCNQMGYYQSSSQNPHVFGNKFPVERLIQQCKDVFGELYNATFIEEQIKNTNIDYGGRDIVNNVNRVVFVQGSIDPWHALGVTSSSNVRSPAIYIIGTSHCADMMSDDVQDLPQLLVARKAIQAQIRSWLSVYQ